jgi:hypothetical protein
MALDDELTCNETITLVESEHSQNPGLTEDFEIRVTKKLCELIECPENQVQDAYYCGCIDEP